jgi:hypothetical protein
MIHHSLTKDGETVSWGAIRRYHVETLKWLDIGYHFGVELVGDDYEVLVGRPLTMQGAHCYQEGMNRVAIGVCCVGNYDEGPPPEEMLRILGRSLIAPLMEIFDIPERSIVFHRDFAQKSCPGEKFTNDEVLKHVRQW